MEKTNNKEYELYTTVLLNDKTTGVIVDRIGQDYVVDIGNNTVNWETILVRPEDIDSVIDGD